MGSPVPKIAPIVALAATVLACVEPVGEPPSAAAGTGTGKSEYTGSESCRECHERFYELWAPSHHGLAMQPFTAELARDHLTPQEETLEIGGVHYRAVFDDRGGRIIEHGTDDEKSYPIVYAMGGKNVYYFLTPLERGRLQALPLAYDVNAEEWFDMPGSAVRHFAEFEDQAYDWRDWPYTFNTSCHGCHVSQVETNYDLATDTYRSTWTEPGINCETCHGGAAGHIRVCREASEDRPPRDLKIILTSEFDERQTNDLCAPCHAKASPLTAQPAPGGRFFDNYHLVGFEDPDFYPDGRDLGENYTHTLWLTSPCAESGQLDCVHCHTSSGRYRHMEDPNTSCMPCHETHVGAPTTHTRHAGDSTGNVCINCHMPETSFARMKRHDHSMRPPTPAATLAFASPNACNLCHEDRDARWADRWVREWRDRDYQAPVMHRAGLIDAARKENWDRLPEMLAYLGSPDREEVFAASLIRLLRGCDDETKWPAFVRALRDPSPLVRSSAAAALRNRSDPEVIAALVDATRDEYRLVRVRAAAALAGDSLGAFRSEDRTAVQQASDEFESTMTVRPDGLRRAVEIDPTNAAANFNLGLLLGELGRRDEAKAALRAALEVDPDLAAAAHNLGILVGETDPAGALRWCGRAAELRPDEPRYAYTLAYYQKLAGHTEAAVTTLREIIARRPLYGDSYLMLGAIYEELGRFDEARELYRRGVDTEGLDMAFRRRMSAGLQALSTR
jgi:Flp pilus assembly protein TadD